jgi:outer membrane murein-binding lipoprotein Lpp
MKLKHAALLALLLPLSGCQKPSDDAAQIAALKAQVNDLSGQVMALHQNVQQLQKAAYAPVPAPVRSTPKAELQVTDGAKSYRRIPGPMRIWMNARQRCKQL